MKILAVFLLCSMLEVVLEVSFAAVKYFFKNRFARGVPTLPATSDSAPAGASMSRDGAPSIHAGDSRGEGARRKHPERPTGIGALSEPEPSRLEADTCK
jgi:hypothetical protein